MRLIDKLGIDLNTVEGIEKMLDMECSYLPCYLKDGCKHGALNYYTMIKCQAEHLLAEVPTKKRWGTYDGDFMKANKDFHSNVCDTGMCFQCKYNDNCVFASDGFVRWLMEDVEVTNDIK